MNFLPGNSELIIVFILVMVLFGYKKLPDATRSIGKSMRIFKAETKGMRDDKTSTATPAPTTTASIDTPPVAPAPAPDPSAPEAVRPEDVHPDEAPVQPQPRP